MSKLALSLEGTYRPWNPDQDWLLPLSPREWLPEGDLVYFMLDVVETLDLSEMVALQSCCKQSMVMTP